MNTLNYNRIQFSKSASVYKDLPPDTGMEVAFAGRSNAGKSSAINAITGQSRLARTSKTPGRTQLLNFFVLDDARRLVDLPGYGYAQVPIEVKLRWQKTMEDYFNHRESLRGVVLMMDIRHPLKPFDWQMIEWAVGNQLPMHILLTKSDKFKRGAANNRLLEVRKALSGYEDYITIQLFSSVQKQGIEDVHFKLNEWLESEPRI